MAAVDVALPLERREHSGGVLVRLLLDRLGAAVAGEVAARRATIPMGSGGVDSAAPPGEAAATGRGAARVLGRWETSLGQAARRVKDGMNGLARRRLPG